MSCSRLRCLRQRMWCYQHQQCCRYWDPTLLDEHLSLLRTELFAPPQWTRSWWTVNCHSRQWMPSAVLWKRGVATHGPQQLLPHHRLVIDFPGEDLVSSDDDDEEGSHRMGKDTLTESKTAILQLKQYFNLLDTENPSSFSPRKALMSISTLLGTDSPQNALNIYHEIKNMFKEATMNHLREWASNCKEFLEQVDPHDQINSKMIKVSDLWWHGPLWLKQPIDLMKT
uniref:Uncharacterized protein n=1 Tax=Romanomermis culicivorax TaxID=13658 RepID=A0A915KYE3_ROMCU